MNRKRRELLDRMLACPPERDDEERPRRREWERFTNGRPGLRVRWADELPTPEWVTRRMWPGETYWRHVSVTMTSETAKPIVRFAWCPWVEARDTDASLERALEILGDPAGALERKS